MMPREPDPSGDRLASLVFGNKTQNGNKRGIELVGEGKIR
jgi:hypothetical protein